MLGEHTLKFPKEAMMLKSLLISLLMYSSGSLTAQAQTKTAHEIHEAHIIMIANFEMHPKDFEVQDSVTSEFIESNEVQIQIGDKTCGLNIAPTYTLNNYDEDGFSVYDYMYLLRCLDDETKVEHHEYVEAYKTF